MARAGRYIQAARAECTDRARYRQGRSLQDSQGWTLGGTTGNARRGTENERAAVRVPQPPFDMDQQPDRAAVHGLAAQGESLDGNCGR